MSMSLDASPSRDFSSSSATRTYWSLVNSYPLTSSLRSTTTLHTGQNVYCRIRDPHLACSMLNATPFDDAAVNILTGMLTRPNEMVPEPMEWGGIVERPPGAKGRGKLRR